MLSRRKEVFLVLYVGLQGVPGLGFGVRFLAAGEGTSARHMPGLDLEGSRGLAAIIPSLRNHDISCSTTIVRDNAKVCRSAGGGASPAGSVRV